MNPNARSVEQAVAPFLNSGLMPSESDRLFDVVNPSNGTRLFSIPAGCEADVDHAVTSARCAFDDGRWSNAPPSFRKQVLHRLADLIDKSSMELDALDAAEMGKPISVAFCNAAAAAKFTRFYAEAIDKVMGDVFGSDQSTLVLQRRVPRGVIAAIVPWNFPLFCAVLKAAPALAAGNCVVLKPSELSSRSALRLAQLAVEAGLPPGVLNIVPGLGETVGKALGLHPDVDMLTFTGSTVVGKKMLEYAGQSNMKAVLAECGGKSPHIVFGDGVSLDAASEAIAAAILTNQGQICSVGSRVLVQRSIQMQLVERITARMKKVVMGDAIDPQTTFGPLVSDQQRGRVMQYIESARQEGARLAIGGKTALMQSGGFFVEPTLFHDVPPSARIAREEIFGPVLSVIPFDDEADATRIANSTMYGLMAYVWTANLSIGMRMAKGVRSSIMVNAAAPKGEGAGFAGSHEPTGQSGIGVEGGLAGMESYLRRQLVYFNHD